MGYGHGERPEINSPERRSHSHMANSFPVTPDQYDRYSRRARARVFWGHRTSAIVESMERKGVRRQQAERVVGKAVREFLGKITLSGLIHFALAGLAALAALLIHSPQVLRGAPMGALDWGHPGLLVLPFAAMAAVLAMLGASKLVQALFRAF
jgi:hypothetical protein